MIRRLACLSRAFRTGLAFAVFGAGALVVAGVGFPVLRLVPGDRAAAERRAQRLVHLSFRVFAGFMTVLGLIRVTRSGVGRLSGQPPAVVVANHPTLIDVVLLIAAMPQADCVVKQAVWRNRFLRGVARGAGYLPNGDGAELVDACAARVREGRWVLLFPEGTRSPRGQLGAFHRGAAHVALRADCAVVPVVITCDPPILGKDQPWYRMPRLPARIAIAVEAPRRPAAVAGVNVARQARDWTADLRALYEARLGAVAAG
jgi:1-acyl-sn-glycerol-3-phosphate acyltransferase